jgi:hypothetical protein
MTPTLRRARPAKDIEMVQGLEWTRDPADHRVTHVLLREGHLWGREAAIPVSAVASLAGRHPLNITMKQAEELPLRAAGS